MKISHPCYRWFDCVCATFEETGPVRGVENVLEILKSLRVGDFLRWIQKKTINYDQQYISLAKEWGMMRGKGGTYAVHVVELVASLGGETADGGVGVEPSDDRNRPVMWRVQDSEGRRVADDTGHGKWDTRRGKRCMGQ